MSEWIAESLPPETIAAVRSELGPLADGIIEAVRRRARSTARCSARPEGMALRLGVEQAIRAFLDAVERGERPARRDRRAVADARRGRVSGRPEPGGPAGGVSQRHPGRVARGRRGGHAAGVSAPATISLAEAIFVYGDELATDVVEGYLRIQSDEAGERERRRRRLAPRCSIRPATIPRRCACRPTSRSGRCRMRWRCWPSPVRTRPRWPGASTSTRWPGPTARPVAGAARPRWAGPPRRCRPRGGRRAGRRCGPTVALADAHRSLRWARLTLELVGGSAPAPAWSGPPITWPR